MGHILTFTNPLGVKLINRDNLWLSSTSFVQGGCIPDKYTGGLGIGPNKYSVHGTHVRKTSPFVVRAIITYKDLPVSAARVTVRIVDLKGGPCEFQRVSTAASKTVLTSGAFDLQVQTVPVVDTVGNSIGTEQTISFVDIPITPPQLPQSARVYVRVESQGFQIVEQMNIFFPTILKMALSSNAPIGNGVDIREQFVRAWLIDPDFPTDSSKITVVPEYTIVKWSLVRKDGSARKMPFYATDSVPLAKGVFSYTRGGTGRYVFIGPAKSGMQGKYTLTADISTSGLLATQSAELEIEIPGQSGFTNYLPDPELPRIFASMPECINYLWADGIDYVRMRIFRTPSDPTKTLVPDETGTTLVQDKYAETFRSCSVDNNGNSTLIPLPIGTVITVNAAGYEILWGDVVEEVDADTGAKYLDDTGATTALDTANITITTDNYLNVYFRKDATIEGKGCRRVGKEDEPIINCCGFDLADKICDDPWEIGDEIGVVLSAKLNISGKPTVIYGGGIIGTDDTSRPPCVLVPREPLWLKFIGVVVNGEIVDKVVADGTTYNEFLYEIQYSGLPLPAGAPLDVYFIVNIDGKTVEKVGSLDARSYFGVPNTIYTYRTTLYPGINDETNEQEYSLCKLRINPIPIDKNIALGIGVSTTYNGEL